MSLVQLAVLSASRREAGCARTLAELEGRGAAQACESRTLFYSARVHDTPPELPPGWRLERREGPRGGGNDFRWMISRLDPMIDAILLEDDVQPCRNAVPAMVREIVPDDCGAISFYDAGDTIGHLYAGHETGMHRVPASGPNDLGFHGAQALRLPAWLIARMQAGQFDPPHVGQDVWLGRVLKGLGMKIAVMCPSLVQHVGEDSLCTPGAKLTGARAPATNFPGEDFDALGTYPEVITPGPWTPAPRVTWCEFHGVNHEDAVICPRVLR
jgi:hypothetical protein